MNCILFLVMYGAYFVPNGVLDDQFFLEHRFISTLLRYAVFFLYEIFNIHFCTKLFMTFDIQLERSKHLKCYVLKWFQNFVQIQT